MSQRDINSSPYLRCPALTGYLKNTFVIRSPYDFTFYPNLKENTVRVDSYNQEFFDGNFIIEAHSDPLVVQFPPIYVFLSDSKYPVTLTMLPWFFKSNTMGFIPGSFDITKWIRSINYAAEIYDENPIVFKRGDPLYCIQFTTKNNDTVVLEQEIMNDALKNTMNACIAVKSKMPNLNLKTLYTISENYINLMKKTIFKSFD